MSVASINSDTASGASAESSDSLIRDLNTDNIDSFLHQELQLLSTSQPIAPLRTRFKKRSPALKTAIERFGVNDAQMNVLMDLILCRKLPVTSCQALIEVLLPRGPVKFRHVVRVLQFLSMRETGTTASKTELPAAIILGLINWIIAIYDHIDNIHSFEKFYGVLFHYLSMKKLRIHLCHLLCRMTRRHHVKKYRIHQLQDLIDKNGPEPELVALMNVFKLYNPELIVPGRSKKPNFANPLKHLVDRYSEIRNMWGADRSTDGSVSTTRRGATDNEMQPRKRQRRGHDVASLKVPLPTTTTNSSLPSVTLREINNVVDLAEKLDRLTLPDQMASILDNRLLQHLIACDPRESSVMRISNWLSNVLQELLKGRNHSTMYKKSLQELLQKCITMARLTKAHLPILETFLKDYISTWNGWEFENEVFELLTFVRPGSFEEINDWYLKPLHRLYYVSDVKWKAKLILCYTEWLKNWALLDWKRHRERRSTNTEIDMDEMVWLFQGLDFNVDYFRTIQHFIYHVDRLSVIGLGMEGDHPLLQHAALSFFEFVSSISINHDIPEIIIPAAPLIYRSFFSICGMSVSRICGIVHQYKKAFEDNDRKIGDWVTRHTSDYLDNFNTHVMDICSALWRNSALARSTEDELPFSLSPEITKVYDNLCESRGESANLVLSLTHSAALAGFSERFIQEKENNANVEARHNGPVTAQLLETLSETGGISVSYMDYRVELLEDLRTLGFHGLYDLLYDCMSSLIERKQKEQKQKEAMDQSMEI
ncbi:Mis6-domain-containing protein [Zychaea mexicana]|uniref:Mis6-domain-containing protein n=1 Tax=Zychaea mexicana TaxID=64656 RepID=UPI0022FEC90F|nr:Mis6-domain-containing protein [Zychaea mexicana]KAI9489715.1 Mis6-domain-containing protein [Zychaea mexicana]